MGVIDDVSDGLLYTLYRIQQALSYTRWNGIHFQENGMGQMGTTGFILGLVGGISLAMWAVSTCLLFLCQLPIFLSWIELLWNFNVSDIIIFIIFKYFWVSDCVLS